MLLLVRCKSIKGGCFKEKADGGVINLSIKHLKHVINHMTSGTSNIKLLL